VSDRHPNSYTLPIPWYRRVIAATIVFVAFLVALGLGDQLSTSLYARLCSDDLRACLTDRPLRYATILLTAEHLAIALVGLSSIVHCVFGAPPFSSRPGTDKKDLGPTKMNGKPGSYHKLRGIILERFPFFADRLSLQSLCAVSAGIAVVSLVLVVELTARPRSAVWKWIAEPAASVVGDTGFLLFGFAAFFLACFVFWHLAYGSIMVRLRWAQDRTKPRNRVPRIALFRVLEAGGAVFVIILLTYVVLMLSELGMEALFSTGTRCDSETGCGRPMIAILSCIRAAGWSLVCEYTRRWWSRTEDA